MRLQDLIRKGVETVSGLYPEGEAKEMVFAYMEDIFGFKRYKHVLEPGFSRARVHAMHPLPVHRSNILTGVLEVFKEDSINSSVS